MRQNWQAKAWEFSKSLGADPWRLGIGAALLLLLLAFVVPLPRYSPRQEKPRQPPPPLAGLKIAIDPGHGGIDGGCSYGTILEKDLVLAISLELKAFLEEQGAQVHLTRDGDVDATQHAETPGIPSRHQRDLTGRVHFARRMRPDVFVSIHINAAGAPRMRGATVFFSGKDDDGRKLASSIYRELVQLVGAGQGTWVDSRLFVLRNVSELGIPAAFVEVAFLSNPEERAKLVQPAFQKEAALAIGRGIISFLESKRNPSNGVGPNN